MCFWRCKMIERIESKLISSNVFVVSHKDSCIIIDAGVEPEIIEKAVGNKKVVGIFLTHGHYDHCYYVESYKNLFGCEIYCSKEAKEYLQNPEYNYSEGQFKIDDFSGFVFLKQNGKIKLGDFEIEYQHLGGHSKSDMCYIVDDEIFVGDVLIGRDMGRIDLYGGSKLKMVESLEYLLNKNYTVMHSGHGTDNEKIAQDKVAKLWIKFLSR